MNKSILKRVLSITYQLREVPEGRNKHFSFIVHRNNIISVGWNNSWKTHPIAKQCGYRFGTMHSELAAIIKMRRKLNILPNCYLVNTRINSLNEIGLSKPCYHCTRWISTLGFKKILYTNQDGFFVEEKNIICDNPLWLKSI